MTRPPAPVPPPVGPVEELIQLLQSARREAKAVAADPNRRPSAWLADRKITRSEAEEEIALGKLILWLYRHGGDWLDARALQSLYRRIRGNSESEEERREICREFVMVAMEELVSPAKGFGGDRMTLRDASDWIAANLPKDLGQIFRGEKATTKLAKAVFSLHDRINRKAPTAADGRLAEAVRRRASRQAPVVCGDGRPFRDRPRIERARLLLRALGALVPA